MRKRLHRGMMVFFCLSALLTLSAWINGALDSNAKKSPYSSEADEILVIGDDSESFKIGIDRYSVVVIHTWAIDRSLNQLTLPKASLYPRTGYVYFEMPTWSDPMPNSAFRVLSVEYWLLALMFAVYPVFFFIRSYRRRRSRYQEFQPCVQCSYDLQGNESGTCPECGTVAMHADSMEGKI